MHPWFIKIWAHIHNRKFQSMAENPVMLQERVLTSIMQNMAGTEFARDHDIDKSTTSTTYQAKIPVRSYEDLYPYVERTLLGIPNILVPECVTDFAKSSGTTNARSKYIPLTKKSLRHNHFKSGKTMVTNHISTTGKTSIMDGKVLGVSGSVAPVDGYPNARAGDISALLVEHLPFWARGHHAPDKNVRALPSWNEKADKIATDAKKYPITGLVGTPTWTAVILESIREKHQSESMHDIWPKLEVFFHGAVSFAPYRARFDALIPRGTIRYTEVYNASEGFFAFQDDQDKTGELRLLLDHGVYYEFIPMDDVGTLGDTTINIRDVKVGTPYALVISTYGGLYRYLIGDTIEFTSLTPHRIKIIGRTTHYINAFGEEVSVTNIEHALADACRATNAQIGFFTVGPRFDDERPGTGLHEWIIAFTTAPSDIKLFTETIDTTLRQDNSDYDAKRTGNGILKMPQIRSVETSVFLDYLKKHNKIGNQNKIPPVQNTRNLIDALGI